MGRMRTSQHPFPHCGNVDSCPQLAADLQIAIQHEGNREPLLCIH
ncbi:hypothetical protein LINGRAHAP2_LOCUS11393 [Linum grandiflorum]